MKDSVIYVGIDVHKDTNSVCMYDRQDNAFFAEAKLQLPLPCDGGHYTD